jgi:hypothetical protein
MANGSQLPGWLLLPARDVLRGLDRCLDTGGRGLLQVAVGLLAGWWIYVPLHEFLHAGACLAAGGTVHRLEIDPLYGGSLLARLFTFIVPANAYAGRLSGFDTHGNDGIYLATDLGPFLLALWPGSWALRRAARIARIARDAHSWRPLLFGLALPTALAPFLSLTGDAYEIGSVLITRLSPWSSGPIRQLLRGDDLLLKVRELAALPHPPWGGAASAALAGIAWAFLTYKLGDRVARALGQPALD